MYLSKNNLQKDNELTSLLALIVSYPSPCCAVSTEESAQKSSAPLSA